MAYIRKELVGRLPSEEDRKAVAVLERSVSEQDKSEIGRSAKIMLEVIGTQLSRIKEHEEGVRFENYDGAKITASLNSTLISARRLAESIGAGQQADKTAPSGAERKGSATERPAYSVSDKKRYQEDFKFHGVRPEVLRLLSTEEREAVIFLHSQLKEGAPYKKQLEALDSLVGRMLEPSRGRPDKARDASYFDRIKSILLFALDAKASHDLSEDLEKRPMELLKLARKKDPSAPVEPPASERQNNGMAPSGSK